MFNAQTIKNSPRLVGKFTDAVDNWLEDIQNSDASAQAKMIGIAAGAILTPGGAVGRSGKLTKAAELAGKSTLKVKD